MPIQLHINGCHGRKTSATGLQAWASECVLEMAVPPVAASAYWTGDHAALHHAAALHVAHGAGGIVSHHVLAQAPSKDPGVV